MSSRKYLQKATPLGERHQGQTDTLGTKTGSQSCTPDPSLRPQRGPWGCVQRQQPPEEMKDRSSPWSCRLERGVCVNVHTVACASRDDICVKYSCPRGQERVAIPGKLEPSSLNVICSPHRPRRGGRKAQADQAASLSSLPGSVAHSVVASFISGTLFTRKIHKMTGFLKKEMLWSGDEVSQSCCFKSHGQSWN